MRAYRAILVVSLVVPSIITTTAKESALYIWDGRGELAMLVQVTDADTRQPIPNATVTLVRSKNATRGPDGSLLDIPGPVHTDSRGSSAALKATFAAEGNPYSTNVLVGNSFLVINAIGYAQGRNWLSTPSGLLDISIKKSKALVPPIDKLQFAPKTQKYKTLYHIALHRRPPNA